MGKTTDAIGAEVRPAIGLYAARLAILKLICCATHGQCALIRAAFGRVGARIAVRLSLAHVERANAGGTLGIVVAERTGRHVDAAARGDAGRHRRRRR